MLPDFPEPQETWEIRLAFLSNSASLIQQLILCFKVQMSWSTSSNHCSCLFCSSAWQQPSWQILFSRTSRGRPPSTSPKLTSPGRSSLRYWGRLKIWRLRDVPGVLVSNLSKSNSIFKMYLQPSGTCKMELFCEINWWFSPINCFHERNLP